MIAQHLEMEAMSVLEESTDLLSGILRPTRDAPPAPPDTSTSLSLSVSVSDAMSVSVSEYKSILLTI